MSFLTYHDKIHYSFQVFLQGGIPFFGLLRVTKLENEFVSAGIEQPSVLTVGVFDGVHLGHKALIDETIRQAQIKGYTSGVITFTGHPRLVLGKHRELPHLTTLPKRLELLRQTGINKVISLTFSEELAALSAADFISLAIKYLSMKVLVIGPDFALGKNREGNADTLKAIGDEMGFTVTVVSPEYKNGQKISSTLIRKAMAESDMQKVHDLLGRCFTLTGTVVHGEGRGTKLGIPTANLEIAHDQALPADGVYAGWAEIKDRKIPAITNIGTRPTFGPGQRTVETHLIDYGGDQSLYGQQMEVAIIEQIRPEQKFSSAESLKVRIKKDISEARRILEKVECS